MVCITLLRCLQKHFNIKRPRVKKKGFQYLKIDCFWGKYISAFQEQQAFAYFIIFFQFHSEHLYASVSIHLSRQQVGSEFEVLCFA